MKKILLIIMIGIFSLLAQASYNILSNSDYGEIDYCPVLPKWEVYDEHILI